MGGGKAAVVLNKCRALMAVQRGLGRKLKLEKFRADFFVFPKLLGAGRFFLFLIGIRHTGQIPLLEKGYLFSDETRKDPTEDEKEKNFFEFFQQLQISYKERA